MSSQAQGPADGRLRIAHTLFFVHLALFLALVVGSGEAWQREGVEALVVADLAGLWERPWTLVTHVFVNVHPLEFVLGATALLLAGLPLEERLGRARLLLLYLLSGALVALVHVALVELELLGARTFAGAAGASAALLTAYLLTLGEEPRTGTVPFPLLYLLNASLVLLMLLVVHHHEESDYRKRRKELLDEAYAASQPSLEERWTALERAADLRAQRADPLTHLYGLCLGAVGLGASRLLLRVHERYRVRREIRDLEAEVDARARVEVLLEKISRHGMGALSRHERKFLRYASRFYQSRAQTLG